MKRSFSQLPDLLKTWHTASRSRAVEDHEARRQSFMSQRLSLMFIKDLQGRYLHVNDRFARAFGLDPKDINSRTDAELFSAQVAAQFRANDAKALAASDGLEFEEVARYGDGVWHTSIVQKFPLLDSNGKVTALGGVATDITERRCVAEALEQIPPQSTASAPERTAAMQ